MRTTTDILAFRQQATRVVHVRPLPTLCLEVFQEFHGPVPYFVFARHVGERLLHRPMDNGELVTFMRVLKQAIDEARPVGLALSSPSSDLSVGYVYDVNDHATWPIVQHGV